MKLYKYRALDHIEYTADILLNERLYCAPYHTLNDPFEGIFLSVTHWSGAVGGAPIGSVPIGGEYTSRDLQSISGLPIPGDIRVCSLSHSLSDVRLWSHYAGGHAGIAVEIEFDEQSDQLYEVNYVDQLKEFDLLHPATPNSTDILCIKSQHWDHEKEYRLISSAEYYSVRGNITGVYFGPRVEPVLQETVMRIVGEKFPAYSTKLNGADISVRRDRQINTHAVLLDGA